MAKEMKHLHLFPDSFPSEQAMIVVNGIRGIDDGKSNRDRVEAAWWTVGFGLSMIPDSHPPMTASAASEEEVAEQLEAAASADEGGMRAFPWALMLPLLLKLIERWMS